MQCQKAMLQLDLSDQQVYWPLRCTLEIWWHIPITETASKLEQLECLRSEDTPAASWLPIPLSHTGSQVKTRLSQSYKFNEFAKILNFEFWNRHYKWHTFSDCLIRCANMKWIRWVLLKIQSGHRRTEEQTDKVKPVYPLSTSLKQGV